MLDNLVRDRAWLSKFVSATNISQFAGFCGRLYQQFKDVV